MKVYVVSGTFKMGLNKKQKFEKEVASENENGAKEKVYSLIGSKHRVERRLIKIESVKEINPKEAKDPVVKSVFTK